MPGGHHGAGQINAAGDTPGDGAAVAVAPVPLARHSFALGQPRQMCLCGLCIAPHTITSPSAVARHLGRIDAQQTHPLASTAQGVTVDDVRRGADEGGGLAVNIGKTYGGLISGVYFETNTGGDVATEKAYVVIGTSSNARGGGMVIEGCNFTVPSSQRDDPDFVCIKEKYATTSSAIAGLSVRDNFTTATRLFEVGKVLNQGGNTIAPTTALGRINSRAPIAPADARKTYWASNDARPVATNNVGGVFTVAAINVQDVIGLPRITGERDACGTIYVRMAHMTAAGGVEFGSALAVVDFIAMGSSIGVTNSAAATNDCYMAFTLRSFTQIPAGLPMESQFGATTKAFFTAPALSVERSGNLYLLKLSGYTNQTIPNWGSSTLMISSVTMEINAVYSFSQGLGANLLIPVGEPAVY